MGCHSEANGTGHNWRYGSSRERQEVYGILASTRDPRHVSFSTESGESAVWGDMTDFYWSDDPRRQVDVNDGIWQPLLYPRRLGASALAIERAAQTRAARKVGP